MRVLITWRISETSRKVSYLGPLLRMLSWRLPGSSIIADAQVDNDWECQMRNKNGMNAGKLLNANSSTPTLVSRAPQCGFGDDLIFSHWSKL